MKNNSKSKHKKILIIIIILIVACTIYYFKDANLKNMTSIQEVKEEISNNAKPDTLGKKVAIGVAGALTAAAGYEAYQI